MKKSVWIVCLLALPVAVLLAAQSYRIYDMTANQPDTTEDSCIDPVFLKGGQSEWVDSVFNSLTPDQRLGQLFMVPVYPRLGQKDVQKVKALMDDYRIGGIIVFQGGPVQAAKLINSYQAYSKTPLMVAIDGEWGVSMRLDSTPRFPDQMTLGAIADERLIYDMGAEVARQCRRLGIHVNFAPVVDVNNNPNNPVINNRSFGEQPYNVARKGFAYMLGMQDNGVIATAKHFPGHGDTDVDSHYDLPVIKHDRQRLEKIELYPFKHLIDNGLAAIMIAHLHIPALDSTPNQASSLSHNIVTQLLKKEMGFKGLIFTDALRMKGVTRYHDTGVADRKALLAGSDMLLMSRDVPKAMIEIKKAIAEGLITQEEIDARCKKILKAKYWLKLNDYQPTPLDSLYEDLNTKDCDYLMRRLTEAALTLVKNDVECLPLKDLEKRNIAAVTIGSGRSSMFHYRLQHYSHLKTFVISHTAGRQQFDQLINQLANYNTVIVSLENTSRWNADYGISDESLAFVERLSTKKELILAVFANPYSLSRINLKKVEACLLAYEDTHLAKDYAAQALFGAADAAGHLPVTVNPDLPAGYGLPYKQRIRLRYSVPRELDIEEVKLRRVDSLAMDAIDRKAFPGCTVLAAKNGVVFFYKSYGYHTYEKKKPVENTDIYDLASITKIGATLPSVISLVDQGKVNVYNCLSQYLPDLLATNKSHLTIIDMLTHQARLTPWIPFYNNTLLTDSMGKKCLDTMIYHPELSDSFTLQLTDRLYMRDTYKDEIYKTIYDSPLRRYRRYAYSDLGFYFMQMLVENQTKQTLDRYAYETFYRPLGASDLCFKPLEHYPLERILPTENDTIFRHQQIHGYVHDQGAAMMGGVAGHAGLFGNAASLATLMQMYLQHGSYADHEFFKATTFDLFNTQPFRYYNRNRRALGFDKPSTRGGPVFKGMAAESFGHTGFTGTTAWADPTTGVVYVFLSNRVYPDAENKKIISLGVRQKIMRALYNSLGLLDA